MRSCFQLLFIFSASLLALFSSQKAYAHDPQFKGLGIFPSKDQSYTVSILENGNLFYGEALPISNFTMQKLPVTRSKVAIWDHESQKLKEYPLAENKQVLDVHSGDSKHHVGCIISHQDQMSSILPAFFKKSLGSPYSDEDKLTVSLPGYSRHLLNSIAVQEDNFFLIGTAHGDIHSAKKRDNTQAFWVQQNSSMSTIVGIESPFPEERPSTFSCQISEDGQTVLATACNWKKTSKRGKTYQPENTLPFLWRNYQTFPLRVPDAQVSYFPYSMSQSGSTLYISGFGYHLDRPTACLWTFNSQESQEFTWLATLPEVFKYHASDIDQKTIAQSISPDGKWVFGSCYYKLGSREVHKAFMWDAVNKMRPLQDILVQNYDLANKLLNWDLWTVTTCDVTKNNNLILVGEGKNPEGNTEIWMALLPMDEDDECPLDRAIQNQVSIGDGEEILQVVSNLGTAIRTEEHERIRPLSEGSDSASTETESDETDTEESPEPGSCVIS